MKKKSQLIGAEGLDGSEAAWQVRPMLAGTSWFIWNKRTCKKTRANQQKILHEFMFVAKIH